MSARAITSCARRCRHLPRTRCSSSSSSSSSSFSSCSSSPQLVFFRAPRSCSSSSSRFASIVPSARFSTISSILSSRNLFSSSSSSSFSSSSSPPSSPPSSSPVPSSSSSSSSSPSSSSQRRFPMMVAPDNPFPPDPERTGILQPIAYWIVRLLKPIIPMRAFREIAVGQALYFRVKNYAQQAPAPELYDLIFDAKLKASPLLPFFLYVLHHRMIEAISERAGGEEEEEEGGQAAAATKRASSEDFLGNPQLVQQVILESWWQDYGTALGDTVGGLLLNKNLIEAQNRAISLFQTVQLAITSSASNDELNTWIRSIVARELYNVADQNTLKGRPALLVSALTEWFLQAIDLIESTSDEQLQEAAIVFPQLPIIEHDPVLESQSEIALFPFAVDGGRLIKLTPEQAREMLGRPFDEAARAEKPIHLRD